MSTSAPARGDIDVEALLTHAGEPVVAAKPFDRVARENHDLCWRTLRRLGVDEDGIEDALQKAFFTFLAKRDSVLPGRERAYLVSVCAGIAANARRGQKRAQRQTALTENLPDPKITPDVELDRRRARELLDQTLAALEPDLRLVFVLHELERMSGPEIAECAGVPLGTVASRLRRARAIVTPRLAMIRKRFEA